MINVHPTEWILLTSTVVGMVLVVRGLVETIKERDRIRRCGYGDGIYGFNAFLNVMDEWVRIVCQLLLLMAAVVFMLASIQRIGPMMPEVQIGRIFLTALSVLLTAKSGLTRWGITKIREMDRTKTRRGDDHAQTVNRTRIVDTDSGHRRRSDDSHQADSHPSE